MFGLAVKPIVIIHVQLFQFLLRILSVQLHFPKPILRRSLLNHQLQLPSVNNKLNFGLVFDMLLQLYGMISGSPKPMQLYKKFLRISSLRITRHSHPINHPHFSLLKSFLRDWCPFQIEHHRQKKHLHHFFDNVETHHLAIQYFQHRWMNHRSSDHHHQNSPLH